jgi:hypothetical protein
LRLSSNPSTEKKRKKRKKAEGVVGNQKRWSGWGSICFKDDLSRLPFKQRFE